MTNLQHARMLLESLKAGLVEQDRLRAEYEQARRRREEAQRSLAEIRRQLLTSLGLAHLMG